MKRLRPYPAYKPTGLAWLPEVPREWEMLHVRELFTERREKVSDDEYEPLSVSRGGVVPQMESVAKSDDGDNRKRVCKGDFVINSRSDRKASSGVSPLDGSVSLVNIVLQPRENYIGSYVHYLLKSNDFVEEYYRNGRGIVADLWTTRYSEMKSISLPVPTKEEQAIIASYLDEKTAKIDRLIELKEREIKLLNEKKQAVISKVVTRGLDPNAELVDSGVDWIGKVPRGWKIDALKHSLDILPGYAFPSNDFNVANGVRLLRGVNVAVGGLRWEEVVYWNKEILPVMKPFVLEEGDLIVGLDRPWISDGTRVAFVTKKDLPALLVQRVCRIRKTASIDLQYVYLWLASVAFERSLTTETTGISVPHISTKQIGDFKIAIPPLPEQRKIVAYLDAEGAKTDKAIAAVTRQIGLLREYRTRLISDAVTGRIDLRKL